MSLRRWVRHMALWEVVGGAETGDLEPNRGRGPVPDSSNLGFVGVLATVFQGFVQPDDRMMLTLLSCSLVASPVLKAAS